MASEVKYGVISDIHENPDILVPAIEALKTRGVERLLVNGDISSMQETLEESQQYIAFILDSIGKSGLEAYVQPGSHETIGAYGPVIDHFTTKYSNIIDVIKNQKFEKEGHDLVFLPGSDVNANGEYSFARMGGGQSRLCMQPRGTSRLSFEFKDIDQLSKTMNSTGSQLGHYFDSDDLTGLVTSPEKTIVVCHVPRRFDKVGNCVDVAHFGQVEREFHTAYVQYGDDEKNVESILVEDPENFPDKLKKMGAFALGFRTFQRGSILPLDHAREKVKMGAPVSIRKENRGNWDLKELYEKLGIKKAVSGHFHESGHRANNCAGQHVTEGKLVDELFWNSGCLDNKQTGILTVNGEQVSYENINL